ncbi:MAG: replicative DNA helicase [Candidatus Paraimprobicoccus trichonymphae]|uniref:Replicative DNA helicase n=1 Tax=Candidatus Paraimprobicoccus trichonymphae TaxID=3033793 RepID=A0AA48HX77_9FIRM|nr:MAG: replicative DNA helicase [Candidatus Paraimprobicoccus trichonymphae]
MELYNLEAEQSVIGAILLDSKCLNRIAEILPNADFFYSENHKLIYIQILDMFINGKIVDYITVLNKLEKSENFKNSNLKTYIFDLIHTVPATSNSDVYAKILKDKYNIRILVDTAKDIIEKVNESTLSSSGILDFAEQKIFDIRKDQNNNKLQKISEIVLPILDNLGSGKLDTGVPIGIADIDRVIMGLNKSDLILLAARPGMGKTSFALNMVGNIAIKEEKTVAIFSLEMTKEQLVTRLLSIESLVPHQKLKLGDLNEKEWETLQNAAGYLSQSNIYIDDTPAITIPEMKSRLKRLKNLDLVIIDYLQLMSSARKIDNRVQEISEITRNLKIMAKELNVPIITLSQLSRASEQRVDHRPVLSDLRDSGSIEQDADIVMFLYRQSYYLNDKVDENVNINQAECIIAKNRHGEIRSVNLHWQGEYMKFTAQEEKHYEY